MLAEHDLRARRADVLGVHNLVRAAILEHPVLVDARLVGKGVLADNRLVPRHHQAGDVREFAAGRHEELRLDAGRDAVNIGARSQGHDDFFERRVAGPLADPVDRHLDLPGAGANAGEAVRDGQTQIVVRVRRENNLVGPFDVGANAGDQRAVLLRRGVAHGVRDIERGRPRLDRRGAHVVDELNVGPGRVHRRELDVGDNRLRALHHVAGLGEHGGARRAQLVLDVDVRGRDEGVDPRIRGIPDGFAGPIDVGLMAAREPADRRPVNLTRDRLHRLEVARRRDREAGLNHIDAQVLERVGDFELSPPGSCSRRAIVRRRGAWCRR